MIQLIVQAVLQQAPRPVQEEGDYFNPPKTVATHISIPISNQQIRVISDIDDTIKISEVLSGVKKIFNNVFVRGLDELIVPGIRVEFGFIMWYASINIIFRVMLIEIV